MTLPQTPWTTTISNEETTTTLAKEGQLSKARSARKTLGPHFRGSRHGDA